MTATASSPSRTRRRRSVRTAFALILACLFRCQQIAQRIFSTNRKSPKHRKHCQLRHVFQPIRIAISWFMSMSGSCQFRPKMLILVHLFTTHSHERLSAFEDAQTHIRSYRAYTPLLNRYIYLYKQYSLSVCYAWDYVRMNVILITNTNCDKI